MAKRMRALPPCRLSFSQLFPASVNSGVMPLLILLINETFMTDERDDYHHVIIQIKRGVLIMRQFALRFFLALLTFIIGVACAISYSALSPSAFVALRARESLLRGNLYSLRKSIDLYSADKGVLPESLDSLISAGYLREIPKDPITERSSWIVEIGDDPNSIGGAKGIMDVHSASSTMSTESSPYSQW
jgi:general secretion pathway protein G